jgi:hypothetical protein
VFRTGAIPITTFAAIVDKYGVKLNEKDLNAISKYISTQSNEIII